MELGSGNVKLDKDEWGALGYEQDPGPLPLHAARLLVHSQLVQLDSERLSLRQRVGRNATTAINPVMANIVAESQQNLLQRAHALEALQSELTDS